MKTSLPRAASYFVDHLHTLALALREAVAQSVRASSAEELAAVAAYRGGDTIYRLDLPAEEVLLSFCSAWAEDLPFLLVAEGLEQGQQVFPIGTTIEPAFTLIVDPVDGTRGLMYGKRSAWALFGVAPRPQSSHWPSLADIQIALQAELPTARAALADVLWAARGEGVQAETLDLCSGAVTSFIPRPSSASTLLGGFATISKFFPGGKVAAAELEEELYRELLGPPASGSAQVFDDQYISSGGQLYELTVGHDRFIADLRPLLPSHQDGARPLCCHPYDLCTWPIAAEAGVVVTDARGVALAAPLDTSTPVAWVGYANAALRAAVEPVLHRLLGV